jgi:hypothetical protein
MNDEQQMQVRMAASVAMAVQGLTDEELEVLSSCVQLDQDPHGRIFDYEKVSSLFTENGKMRPATKEALAQAVELRLAGNKK